MPRLIAEAGSDCANCSSGPASATTRYCSDDGSPGEGIPRGAVLLMIALVLHCVLFRVSLQTLATIKGMPIHDESSGTYADQVTITFNQVSDRTAMTVLDSYEVTIHPNGTSDLDWLSDEIKDIFRFPEPDPATGIRYSLDNYVLSQRRTELCWGASATVVQFIVDTAAFLGEAGAGAVVGAAVNELVGKLKARGYNVTAGKPAVLSDDEAIQRGLEAIESDYATTLSTLSPKSVGKNTSGHYVVTASDGGGSIYTVAFVVKGGVTDVVSRDRTLPADS